MNAELARQVARIKEVRARIHGGHVVEPPPTRVDPLAHAAPRRPRVVVPPRDHWLARDFGTPADAHCRHRERVLRARDGALRCSDVIAVVCDVADVTLEELLGREVRTARPVAARQAGMYLARRLVGTSNAETGRRFGGRDHSTVVTNVQRVARGRGTGDRTDAVVAAVLRRLGLPDDAA